MGRSPVRSKWLPNPALHYPCDVVAIERLRAYLTRGGEPAAAASAIGGIEAHAKLEPRGLVCTVQVSDLAADELVVVEVEVALYAGRA
jgi:hypothetical protein